jgi:hypothetical protein
VGNSQSTFFWEQGTRMNYAEYLRRQSKGQSKIIGFKNGQDASQVTYKAQAIASSGTNFTAVETSHSKIGGSIANIAVPSLTTDGNYIGVSNGLHNADRSGSVIGAALHCAVCSDAPSSEPYNIVLPCVTPLPIITSEPAAIKCCKKDYSQLFRDNSEITRQQGLQSDLRVQYNLPNKLQGLRGPIVLNR